jgi:uncharacterized protein (DUF433 family)
MKEHTRVEIRPDVMFGKPAIKNARITVEHILRKPAGRMTFDEIIADHPILSPADLYWRFRDWRKPFHRSHSA